MKKLYFLLAAGILCMVPAQTTAQESAYQRPAREIEEIALTRLPPVVSFSDTNNWMLELVRSPFYSIEELAQPELKLAGVRIDPQYYCESRQRSYQSAVFTEIATGKRIQVDGLPEKCDIAGIRWYPNTDKVLLFVKEANGIYLYNASTKAPQAVKLSDRALNATMGFQIEWISDSEFLALTLPKDHPATPPARSAVPTGPVIQESAGKKTGTRTYQDLLKNKSDELDFEYYFTSQLTRFSENGAEDINRPAIYSDISISPDRSFLITETIVRPYSYSVPMYYFPSVTSIINLSGKEIKTLAKTPVYIPALGYDTTSPYPRGFRWRADQPATVYWIEAQDEGDPRKNKVEYMDIAYQLSVPFTGEKEELVKTKLRFGGVAWGNKDFALLYEYTSATRRTKAYRFKPDDKETPALLYDLSMDDKYNHPGNPVTVKNQYDRYVLYTKNKNNELLMTSDGASPEGNMPYISSYNIAKKQNNILWRCKSPYYERIVRVVDPARLTFISSRQSNEEPVNYFLHNLKSKRINRITEFANPYPSMKGVIKEKIRYKRADGVDLTATVYLPAGYDKEKDGKLPVLMWAYPIEYKSSSDAAQVRGSTHTFTYINYGSPVFWVLRGFCVMDNVEMPIVGEKDTEPNDRFVEQVVMNAEAAVKAISDLGVGDPGRVAVGGHSYGAFMTANLMVHTKLFKAGIARSGAYNRTLTPFGFQAERRTYWEAPDVYNTMSPFMQADKLHGALLLIHGEADNNTGTFPMQSERFYQALKGHGATVRYVVLPLESHGYSAKENILHMLYEEDEWLHKHVK